MQQKFIDIAKVQLGEDELRRTQSLAHFRAWLEKHPFLKDVRQDDIYLLKFLRARKYSMDATFELFERTFLAPTRFPQYFENINEGFDKCRTIFEKGVIYPLSERDESGCRIVFCNPGRIDSDLYTSLDGFRLMSFVTEVIIEEEETQIAGVKFIINCHNATLKHWFPAIDAKGLNDYNAMPLRAKGSYVVNLPSFAILIADLIKSVLNEKLRNRIFMIKSFDELKNHISLDLLPKEFGGIKPEAEMMNEFKAFWDERKKLMDEHLNFKVDLRRVSAEKLCLKEREMVGSFRKLEID